MRILSIMSATTSLQCTYPRQIRLPHHLTLLIKRTSAVAGETAGVIASNNKMATTIVVGVAVTEIGNEIMTPSTTVAMEVGMEMCRIGNNNNMAPTVAAEAIIEAGSNNKTTTKNIIAAVTETGVGGIDKQQRTTSTTAVARGIALRCEWYRYSLTGHIFAFLCTLIKYI